MHTKSKEFGDTDRSCFKIEWDCLCEGGGNPSGLGGRVRRCLFGFWFTVDRHGLRPRDDKSGCGGSAVRLLRTIGSPRAFSPRDDKGG